jgi:polar amino acid transport system substrate-binding protein
LKPFLLLLLVLGLISSVEAKSPLVLANDPWPPFILEGEEQGTAEMLACQALERSGWECRVKVDDWENVLSDARIGAIDGIAAAWKDPDRETYLLFSEPYLTNRIVPAINNKTAVTATSLADLNGRRVALVTDYAYGEEIAAAVSNFEVVEARNSREALEFVQNGKADIALVDELVGRNELEQMANNDLELANAVLAFRDLHFAVSRQNPHAEQIVDDFQRAYKLMLEDGTVNEILNVDWLATDFGQEGTLNYVMRSGISLDDLDDPSDDGGVFATDSSGYALMRERDLDSSRVKYQVDGKPYSSLQSALDDVFGKDTVCKHKNYTSQFDCSEIFNQR